jgi:PAS domain S-box-containing protein
VPKTQWQEIAAFAAVVSFFVTLYMLAKQSFFRIAASVRRVTRIPAMIESSGARVEDIYIQTIVNLDIGESMAERSGVLIWRAGPDGGILYVSEFFVAKTGYSREQVIGNGWLSFVAENDRDRVHDEWEKAVNNGYDFDITYDLVTRYGDTLSVRSKSRLLRDRNGIGLIWNGALIPADSDPFELHRVKSDMRHGKLVRQMAGLRDELVELRKAKS